MVALDVVTLEFGEDCELLGCLHAFGNDATVEGVRKLDDAADDRPGLWIVADAGYEAPVNFDNFDRESSKVGEGRISGAEVVHRKVDS